MSLAVGARSSSRTMGFKENKEIAEKNGILMANEGKKLEKGEDGDDVEEGEGEEVLNRKMSEASLYATEDDDEEEDGKGAKGIDLGPKVSLKDQLEKDKVWCHACPLGFFHFLFPVSVLCFVVIIGTHGLHSLACVPLGAG